MKPSRKFLSLPIISLHEGQHIGYVKTLILDAQTKSLAALVVDPKGFFKDQRIIPYAKVVSVGDDAITIDKSSQVDKSTNLPEILDLLKQKLNIIGTKVVTEAGKTLGIAEEYYIDPANGKITGIDISGGKIGGLINGKANLHADQIKTIGHDVIVAVKGSENCLLVSDKGLGDAVKNILHTTKQLASDTTQALGGYLRKGKKPDNNQELPGGTPAVPEPIDNETAIPGDPAAVAVEPSSAPAGKEPVT